MTLKQVIEALVFASPKPITAEEIRGALRAAGERAEEEGPEREHARCAEDEITLALAELRTEYGEAGRGYLLVEQVNGWALLTNPAASAWVRRLYPEAKPTRLSGPALETLAIIAYRQPVTRADVEAVRGVAVDGVMQVLLDRSLVKITGRAEVPGRPLLYGTTEFFLQHFGLKNVEELPNSAELKRYPLPTAPAPPEAAREGEAPAEPAAVSEPNEEDSRATDGSSQGVPPGLSSAEGESGRDALTTTAQPPPDSSAERAASTAEEASRAEPPGDDGAPAPGEGVAAALPENSPASMDEPSPSAD